MRSEGKERQSHFLFVSSNCSSVIYDVGTAGVPPATRRQARELSAFDNSSGSFRSYGAKLFWVVLFAINISLRWSEDHF
jgi:hypothetical protein